MDKNLGNRKARDAVSDELGRKNVKDEKKENVIMSG